MSEREGRQYEVDWLVVILRRFAQRSIEN
jgi:hypothetical protein